MRVAHNAGDFNLRCGWAHDGEVSCTDWLVSRCGLSRVTAKDKLRVARELSRRPAVRTAFAAGELSYTKVRAITRIAANDETDRWLLKLAERGTAADLEVAVRDYLHRTHCAAVLPPANNSESAHLSDGARAPAGSWTHSALDRALRRRRDAAYGGMSRSGLRTPERKGFHDSREAASRTRHACRGLRPSRRWSPTVPE
jgi:hypothetical protein